MINIFRDDWNAEYESVKYRLDNQTLSPTDRDREWFALRDMMIVELMTGNEKNFHLRMGQRGIVQNQVLWWGKTVIVL